jgi:hypothetical protein
MKKRPEDDLLNDIFPRSRNLRAATLEQTIFSARQQRQRHKFARVGGVVTLCLGLLLVALNSQINFHDSPMQVAAINSSLANKLDFPTVPGTSIRIINDEELLKMFENRPVAFIGPPEDRQFIVLDEIKIEMTSSVLN